MTSVNVTPGKCRHVCNVNKSSARTTEYLLERDVTAAMFSPKKLLEFVCVMIHYFTVILGGFNCSTLLVVYLLFTPVFPVVLIYMIWSYLNWNIPSRGGRDFGAHFMRRLSIFKYTRDYYPITLTKTVKLDPQKNYIFGYHPHGVLVEGAAIGFATEAVGFSEKFPGITPHLTIIGCKYSVNSFFLSNIRWVFLL